MSRLTMDNRFESSINRLKAMGLKFYIERVGDNQAYLVIDMESVVRMIDRRITYPNRKSEMEGKMMIIHFWRGDNEPV